MSKIKADITYTDSRGNIWDLMVDEISEMPEDRNYAGRITSANFHTYQWEKEATEKRFGEKLRAWKKNAKTFEVVSIFQGTESFRASALNAFHDALEYDIRNFQPGVLQWEEYSIDVYGSEVTTEPSDEFVNTTANKVVFYAPDPSWYRIDDSFHFDSRDITTKNAFIREGEQPYSKQWLSETPGGGPLTQDDKTLYVIRTEGDEYGNLYKWFVDYYKLVGNGDIKDYEIDEYIQQQGYNYEYDYLGEDAFTRALQNSDALGSKYIMTIHGPAINPEVQIVNHKNRDVRLTVSFPNTTVPNKGTLTVNSVNKTAVLADVDGNVTNVFGARNPDYYLWDYVSGGVNFIYWDGTFVFDITLVEERSEPKWLTD